MPIYRGSGGAGDSTTDATVTEVTQQAINAANSATQAATSASNAATSANNASTSATASAASASNAASSASSASTSASSATSLANAASSSATSAATSASAASTSATAAQTAETNAETAETNAESAQAYAEEWATKAEDSLISTAAGGDGSTDYSALHHAAKAATSETNAATSETNAATSATSASNSATASANSATTAATSATSASNSASAAATSATSAASSAASAASALDNFDDRYLGSYASDPATDNDGDPLIVGALYFNTTDGVMKVYTASGWIAASSASVATMVKYNFTATNGQTVFSGADDNTETLSLTVGAEIVTLNGVVLEQGTDYTATSSAITLTSGASTSDELNVFAFGNFTVADTVSASAGGTFAGAVDFDGAVAFNSTVTGIATDLVDDTTPQLGGNLDTNGNDITFGDNDKAIFGAGSDLQIYHSGTHSEIVDTGTGNLRIRADDLRVQTADGNASYIRGTNAGTLQLYHNGLEKLATTSTGIDVTGTAVTDGLTVAGNVSVDGGTIKLDGNYPVGTNNVALGNTALDAVSGGFNTAIGSGALTANTSGASNTAVGEGALEANTTASNNTAVGRDALFTNTTGASNTAVGFQALGLNTASNNTAVGYNSLVFNSTGTANTAVGTRALEDNTTGTNTAVGYVALTNNTTGSSNTALGYIALGDNTTASNNTAVGHQALTANTTGNSLTAVGASALDANTTGTDNTAVGVNALGSNTSGDANIAIGVSALKDNTTANNNIAIGYTAMLLNTTGQGVAVGPEALYANTTGTNNVAVGLSSMRQNTTGGANVAVGRGSLQGNTTHSNNTAVGYYALNTNSNHNNTAIGYNTFAVNTTGTNGVAVGAYALDANTTGTDNTGIGRSSLSANTTGPYNTAVGKSALESNATGEHNTAIGRYALGNSTGNANTALGSGAAYLVTGSGNTFVGADAGYYSTTGSKNTILGRFTGNQGGLDIRTGNNQIVLSDGDGNPRVHVNANGYFRASNSQPPGSSFTDQQSHYVHSTASDTVLRVNATNASFASGAFLINVTRSATSGYRIFETFSGDYNDKEHELRGDGNAYADGSWNGGGADYAEYFEWLDGNPDAEDRRGYSVVLDGDKIRKATDSDSTSNILGVISGNPSVVGDTDIGRWKQKYLRDDFGAYILDEDGHRVLNPDYDEDAEYISREDRPEWDTVGLMGKLRIRKGQPVGDRWIKMRDVSDSVEEWLVR
jgi:chemotaxis protein histidine kinase CheA